jgi:hypothetical protein
MFCIPKAQRVPRAFPEHAGLLAAVSGERPQLLFVIGGFFFQCFHHLLLVFFGVVFIVDDVGSQQ